MSLQADDLRRYVAAQAAALFPDGVPCEIPAGGMRDCLDRVDLCFSAVREKYFFDGTRTVFNHMNSNQYAMFLYFLANTLHRNGVGPEVCDKIFYLNKALNGVDVYYTVELPRIFVFVHSIGIVMGRAKYSDYLMVHQNCTVGSNHITDYPEIGRDCAIYKGASVLGKCRIGDGCKISAGSLLIDQDLEDHSLYIGTPSSHQIRKTTRRDPIWVNQEKLAT